MEEAAVAGQQVGCGFVSGALIAGSVLAVGVAVPYRRSTIAAHSSMTCSASDRVACVVPSCSGAKVKLTASPPRSRQRRRRCGSVSAVIFAASSSGTLT